MESPFRSFVRSFVRHAATLEQEQQQRHPMLPAPLVVRYMQ